VGPAAFALALQQARQRRRRRRRRPRGYSLQGSWLQRSGRATRHWSLQGAFASGLSASDDLHEPTSNGHPLAADERVRGVVVALPPQQRLTVFLRYYADLDYATIAERSCDM
jgi:DNA-directed RNA polymerase specialized sigma24 family protein